MKFASRIFLLAIVVLLVSGTSTYAYYSDTFDVNPILANSQTPGAWYVDRYAPAEFKSVLFDGDNRLNQKILGTDKQETSFHNSQGRKYDIDLEGSVQSVSIDLYVGPDWDTNKREVGIWATGFDTNGSVSAYPIIAFRNYGQDERPGYPDPAPAGFYNFDYNDVVPEAWISDPSVTSFGQWYNLEMVLTVGTGMEYFLDGVSFATYEDTGTTSLGNIILNAYNFGEDYDIYWDNVTASSVPIPAAAWLLGTGLLGLIGIRRKIHKA